MKRPSLRTGECAIRASFSIKGVKLITTTAITIIDANWGCGAGPEVANLKRTYIKGDTMYIYRDCREDQGRYHEAFRAGDGEVMLKRKTGMP